MRSRRERRRCLEKVKRGGESGVEVGRVRKGETANV